MPKRPNTTRMLISKSEDRWKEIDATKVASGAFLTKSSTWLLPHILQFIVRQNPSVILDPFAGNGDMLKAVASLVPSDQRGYDIDPTFGWPRNDSLTSIPHHDNCLILTNPPYLAKHSAKRKRVHDSVCQHFDVADDLYKVALLRCIEAAAHVVAIVPETFLNSEFPKTHCDSITVVLENPFTDTECPVCVLCMSRTRTLHDSTAIYVGETYVSPWHELAARRAVPTNSVPIIFNHVSGRLALRAVDGVRPSDRIRFVHASEFHYTSDIKHSSRLMTRIEIPSMPDAAMPLLIKAANTRLEQFRSESHDVLLSPFKGNTHAAARRRRLDYFTARALLEAAYDDVCPPHTTHGKQRKLPGFA